MKSAFRILPFVLAAAVSVPAARPAAAVLWFEAPPEGGGARGVQGAVEEFFSADNRNDIERLASIFEEDGIWLPSTGEVVSGRQAISAWYRARHLRWTPKLSAAVLDLRVDRTFAVVQGAARGTLVPAGGGAAVPVDDRFVMVLSRNAGNSWRVTRLLWRRGAAAS